jgi:hypothetical protein
MAGILAEAHIVLTKPPSQRSMRIRFLCSRRPAPSLRVTRTDAAAIWRTSYDEAAFVSKTETESVATAEESEFGLNPRIGDLPFDEAHSCGPAPTCGPRPSSYDSHLYPPLSRQ